MAAESPSNDRRLLNVSERWQRLFRLALSLTYPQELSKFKLANDGHKQAFAHVLDLAYGRKGPLKWRIMTVRLIISCLCETLPTSRSPYSPTPPHQHLRESFHPSSARVHPCTVQSLLRCSYPLILARLGSPPNHPIFAGRRRYHRGQIRHRKMLVYLDHLASVEKSTSAGAIFRANGNGCTHPLRFLWDNRERRRLLPKRMPSSPPGFEVSACKLRGY